MDDGATRRNSRLGGSLFPVTPASRPCLPSALLTPAAKCFPPGSVQTKDAITALLGFCGFQGTLHHCPVGLTLENVSSLSCA